MSAGLVLWRRNAANDVEVVLVHPSGAYNKKAPWGIPKGEPDAAEEPEQTARREVREETGVVVDGPVHSLGHIDYTKSRKRVFAFAAPLPDGQTPKCASWEIDRAELMTIEAAKKVIHVDQSAFLDRLVAHLAALEQKGRA